MKKKVILGFKELVEGNENLSEKHLQSLGSSQEDVISALYADYNGFEIKTTKEEFFAMELPYLIKYGDTAFNAGYRGLAKTNPL